MLIQCIQIKKAIATASVLVLAFCLSACTVNVNVNKGDGGQEFQGDVRDSQLSEEEQQKMAQDMEKQQKELENMLKRSDVDTLRDTLGITEDYRTSFVHGEKGKNYQKYIMLHDTEGNNNAASVISGWDANGAGVAAHFIVNKDGTIWQCVPLDKIAHHAGYGDTGHNAQFGVEDESRDDKVGTVSIGSSFADYGMNSWSVGIEIVHVGGSGDYPEEQLVALDSLIAYIDAYYGFESEITDHKAWRSGNSDTSAEFSQYLANYKQNRKHTAS